MATYETIDDLKAGIERIKIYAKNIRSNLNRIEKEYQDWEDQVRDLEKAIQQAMDDAGLTKEEITEKLKEVDLRLFDE